MVTPYRHRMWNNRFLLTACAAILGIASISFITSASDNTPKPSPTVLAAQRFDLLDKKGDVVASISGEGAPWAQVGITVGNNPRAVATLSASDHGPFVMRFFDRDGRANAAVSLGNESGSEITLFEPNGKAKTILGLDTKGNPSFKLIDSEGKITFEVPK